METRNFKLTIEQAKKWYQKGGELKEVALQVFSEVELKNKQPRSWEEYCNQTKGKSLYYIDENGVDGELGIDYAFRELEPSVKNSLPTRELAEKFIAYMQLMSLRKAWIDDWEQPASNTCFAICYDMIEKVVCVEENDCGYVAPLSFPTKEMAEDFNKCFYSLLTNAIGLY